MEIQDLDDVLREEPYPLQNLLGYEMTGWKDGWSRFNQPIIPQLTNRHGIVHGGVYSVLLDSVMGHAGCYTGDPEQRVMAITLSLNVNFLSRPKGKVLIAEGWRTGGGKSSFFTEGKIHDETGELIATGTAVFRYRKGG